MTFGDDVASAFRSVGIRDATYDNWRKRIGGMGRAQLSELKSLAKENARLKKIAVNHWLKQYNHTRPHQTLSMRPPVPETVLEPDRK